MTGAPGRRPRPPASYARTRAGGATLSAGSAPGTPAAGVHTAGSGWPPMSTWPSAASQASASRRAPSEVYRGS